MSDLVSGEAVVLDLRSARAASRGLAFGLDAVLQITLLIGLILGASAVADGVGGDTAATAAFGLVAIVTALVGYPLVFETATRGRSPGKFAFGLRVVRNDGGAVRFRHSLVRALFGVIELWVTVGVIAFIASLSSEQGRRLGDQFAGTVVVYVRPPRSTDIRWTMPPRLAGWAAQADLSGLSDALALEVRTFLLRTPELNPQARWSLAVRLADAVQARVSPPPPPGVAPEEYLVAVLAERRQRAEAGTPQGLQASAHPTTPQHVPATPPANAPSASPAPTPAAPAPPAPPAPAQPAVDQPAASDFAPPG